MHCTPLVLVDANGSRPTSLQAEKFKRDVFLIFLTNFNEGEQIEKGFLRKRVRTMGLRRSRSIGKLRTHLQHVATATTTNVCRLYDWLQGISLHASPLSHFARLMKEAA